MTAALENELTSDVSAEQACECCWPKHHPNQNPQCDQDPKYDVCLMHWHACGQTGSLRLCQDCLDEAMEWAAALVGAYCAGCLYTVHTVSDLIGPVISL